MSYTIIVITDGKESWKKDYDNCVDAVNAYNKFSDYGFARLETLITLVEPDMKVHTKSRTRSGVDKSVTFVAW